MIWTNLSDRITAFLAGIILCMATLVMPVCAQQSPFNDLKHKFKEGKIFHAEFSHRYIDSYTHDTTTSKGVIWVGKERYKVRTQDQSVVVDGKTSMVYDDNRNRVIISKYDPAEDDFAPSRILNGIDSTYTLQRQAKEEGNGDTNILLTSDDPFATYKRVKITLNKAEIPLRIEALDPADNLITTTFEGGSFVSVRQGMFHLDYPEGAEIVDMRTDRK